MLSKGALLLTVGVVLVVGSALPLRAGSHAIHPDCLDHQEPLLCTLLVEELTAELGLLNETFSTHDADRLAAFYREDAILYVGSAGRFFRGRTEIKNDFFAPLVATINSATVDLAAFHFRVSSPDLLVLYGSPTTTVTFTDGTTVTLPPLPQTLTWVRQGGDRARPFLVLTDQE